ncbi:glycosyltransferase family 2 protein [Pandoraea communis]|uniref:glycosyltransferase family 2 protein n=1 Tax=Pandoraea communis TaxID=2508297 RepID=UPI0025A65EDE|nr:glycosyltransferase [Pandoraea communis]MDM8355014.1 glycosyltransferase [Pandoraea communis]
MGMNESGVENQLTELTVSIVSHGHGECLKRLFADIESQDLGAHLKVLLTLNLPGETFCTSSYPGISIDIIRNSSPAGFGHNHNKAFAKCRTKYFLILNPDVRLREPGVLRSLVDLARKDGGDGLWAPLITNLDGVVEDSVRHNLSPLSVAKRALRRETPISRELSSTDNGPFFWVAGMAMLVTSDAFRRVGGFDQRFFLYCEDYDLCARFYAAGLPIRCVSQVVFIHDAQRDSHRSMKYFRLHVTSLLKVWMSGAYWRVVFGGNRRGER